MFLKKYRQKKRELKQYKDESSDLFEIIVIMLFKGFLLKRGLQKITDNHKTECKDHINTNLRLMQLKYNLKTPRVEFNAMNKLIYWSYDGPKQISIK